MRLRTVFEVVTARWGADFPPITIVVGHWGAVFKVLSERTRRTTLTYSSVPREAVTKDKIKLFPGC